MAFKTDTSFLRFLTMGALAVHRTIELLEARGFRPVELERYCGSNKIWSTKIKRLRLPDLLCVRTGVRIEVKAKSVLKVRMSDAPTNPDRVWDAGLRGNDVIAFIRCLDDGHRVAPADRAAFFLVEDLRGCAEQSKLGSPKSASEGAERDRTWPTTVPSRSGTVLEVSEERLVVQMDADHERASRRQTYDLRGRSAYVAEGESFVAGAEIIAGLPPKLANLQSFLGWKYSPLDEIRRAAVVDRYAAVKSLLHRDDLGADRLTALDALLKGDESEPRVRLEAAGAAAALGSSFGEEVVRDFIWANPEQPELKMEAILILAERGDSSFALGELVKVAEARESQESEVRQAAVWGLGKAGLRRYEALLPFIADDDERVSLHSIAAMGAEAPESVIRGLLEYLLEGDSRRAPAAAEALKEIGTTRVLESLIEVAHQRPADWVLATLGQMPPEETRRRLAGTSLLSRVSPLLLAAPGSNWLARESTSTDLSLLRAQDVR